MTEKEKKLLDAYNGLLEKWGFKTYAALPVTEDGFCVGEMDNFLCDANFGWYRDKGITETVEEVALYFDPKKDRLKVMAFIDGSEFLVGYVTATVDDVIRIMGSIDDHEDTDIMIDKIDAFFGVKN